MMKILWNGDLTKLETKITNRGFVVGPTTGGYSSRDSTGGGRI